MDRRSFFQNLLWGTAGVAVAPKLIAQTLDRQEAVEKISQVDYPKPPEQLFNSKQGLWVFHKGEVVAYSHKHEVSVEMYRPVIDITHLNTPGVELGYREFVGGKPTTWYDVENLKILNEDPFYKEEVVQTVFQYNDTIIEGDAIWDSLVMHFTIDQPKSNSARFTLIGNTVMTVQ